MKPWSIMAIYRLKLIFFSLFAMVSGSELKPSGLIDSAQFYCTRAGKVVVLFNENSGRSLPRIFGVRADDVCETRSKDRMAVLLCDYSVGSVNLIIEYDEIEKYSLAQVTCPENGRQPRQNVKVMADKLPNKSLGKANAVMEIGLDYDDLSEIQITCQPSGMVYVTNPEPIIFKHMFSYNAKGSVCVTLILHENIVEISDCDQETIIEIVFSEDEFENNIIGGKGEMKVYKFNCTDIGMDPVFFRQIMALNGGTSVLAGSLVWLVSVATVETVLRYFRV